MRSTPLDQGKLARRIRSGELTHGAFCGMGHPASAEIMAVSGLDWVLLDLEHGGSDESHIGQVVASTGGYGTATLVRVESLERIRIGRALDAGAAGIMLPRINDAIQVEETLCYFRYPPQGMRGVATYNRSVRWGLDTGALDTANSEALCIVQIETLGALNEVEEIAALDGVDVLFIGPLDLSYALGTPRNFESEEFKDAVDRVLNAARKAGISAGILSANTDVAEKRAAQGFTFLPVGSDSTLLANAARDVAARLGGARHD
ncbi:HpcH/HpaI aldolase/citrate lyase family protein [Kocuria sp. TGY1127_2]|uniref:HpcH/HpaI aldolase family protein n=1 Tax=Kocuria sp. TGY1127_2 TaxID=2711328 RepID=UPI0015B96AE0|nr:aldolase/citrate lyase family protein [Kocuria sp. TGY1127_2]